LERVLAALRRRAARARSGLRERFVVVVVNEHVY
jgi:hypothetical protein